jgi:hypothetical protein
LVAPIGTSLICYTPVDPYGQFNGAPQTLKILSSDSGALPPNQCAASAWDSLDTTDSSDDTMAPVATDPLGLVWYTLPSTSDYGRLYLWGELGLGDFNAKYGGPPEAITLLVKIRQLATSGFATPNPVFSLVDGNDNSINVEMAGTWLAPTTDWGIYTRDFASAEIGLLTLDGSLNQWEIDFWGNRDTNTPPEPVEVAWIALAILPPN